MDATKHALVLTGEALPGFDANTVWPARASYFRMEPDRLRSDLLARAPITIKESEDLGKLRNLQDGASTIGAVTDLVAMGSEGNMFVLVDGTPRERNVLADWHDQGSYLEADADGLRVREIRGPGR